MSFWQQLSSSCSVLLPKVVFAVHILLSGANGFWCMPQSSSTDVCFLNKVLQTGSALVSHAKCFEACSFSQRWKNQSFQRAESTPAPHRLSGQHLPGDTTALARKSQEGTACTSVLEWWLLAPPHLAGACTGLYLKFLRILGMLIATLQMLSQNLCLPGLACSPWAEQFIREDWLFLSKFQSLVNSRLEPSGYSGCCATLKLS